MKDDRTRLDLGIPTRGALAAIGLVALAGAALAVVGLTDAGDESSGVAIKLWVGLGLSLVTAGLFVVALIQRRSRLFEAEREVAFLEHSAVSERVSPDGDMRWHDARRLADGLAEAGAYDLALRAYAVALRLDDLGRAS